MSTPRPLRWPAWIQGDRAAVCLLVTVFLLLNYPLLTGQASTQWDGQAFFAPLYNYLASLVRTGSLLRWNPFCNGGSPDFAEPQLGAASPLMLGCALLAGPGPFGFHLYWLATWLFGGLGMYVLARSLGAPPWGALVSALGFVLGGFYLGYAEQHSVVSNYSFVPWIVWRVRAAMSMARWLPACEAGALWGLSALAGNPAVLLPATFFVFLIAPAFLPALPPDRAVRWHAVRTYAVTMTLLIAVGTIVLLPTYGAFWYEIAGYSHRSQPLPREAVLCQGYGFGWLTALFTPAFVPWQDTLPAWQEFDVAHRLLYIGAPVLVLAAFAAGRRGAWREWLFLAAGLLCLGMAMGTTLPLRGWLYVLAPPTRFVRNPATFRGSFILAATILAALGTARVEAVRRLPDATRRLRLLAAFAGVGALLGVASYLWNVSHLTAALRLHAPRSAGWQVAFAWFGTLTLCLVAVYRAGFRRFLPGALVALTTVDLSVSFLDSRQVVFASIPSMPGRDPSAPLDNLGLAGWARPPGDSTNDNIYVRQPTFMNYTAMVNVIQEDWSNRPAMCQCVCGPQRLWFAAAPPTVPATKEAYVAFRMRGRTLGTLPVVRHERTALLAPPPANSPLSPQALEAIATAPAARLIPLEALAYRANDLALRINAPSAGYLLVTERWARSWETTVNDEPVTTDGGDFLFRLVPVRAGENVVIMHYQLMWWYGLIALSWLTLAIVAAFSLYQRFRRPAPLPPPPAERQPAPTQERVLAMA